MTDDWLSNLRSQATYDWLKMDGLLIGWVCRKCGRIWKPEAEHCECGNPGPQKQPGPREFK